MTEKRFLKPSTDSDGAIVGVLAVQDQTFGRAYACGGCCQGGLHRALGKLTTLDCTVQCVRFEILTFLLLWFFAPKQHRQLLSVLVWAAFLEEAVLLMLLMVISSDLGRGKQVGTMCERSQLYYSF